MLLFEESHDAAYKPIVTGDIVFIGGKKKKTRKEERKIEKLEKRKRKDKTKEENKD